MKRTESPGFADSSRMWSFETVGLGWAFKLDGLLFPKGLVPKYLGDRFYIPRRALCLQVAWGFVDQLKHSLTKISCLAAR